MAFTDEQLRNARIIASVGEEMGMSRRDIKIAFMTALQESGLRNLHYGDRDSQGLFQQRPSQGWGTVEQVTDPYYASRQFFKHLKAIGNRDSMALTVAAQSVQRSAFPDAYAKWANEAKQILHEIGGGSFRVAGGHDADQRLGGTAGAPPSNPGFQPMTGNAPSNIPQPFAFLRPAADTLETAMDKTANSVLGIQQASAPMDFNDVIPYTPSYATPEAFNEAAGRNTGKGVRRQLIKYAKQFVGTPYVWGGTSPNGFDCSGFTQYVFKHFGIDLPRISADQGRTGKRRSVDQLRAGDLVFWDNSSRNNGADHVAIYLGNGMILEAPRPGLSVQVSQMYDSGSAWGVRTRLGR